MRTARHSSECSSARARARVPCVTGSVTAALCCQAWSSASRSASSSTSRRVRASSRPNDSQRMRPSVEAPRAGDGAVDEEGRRPTAASSWEDPRPMLLGEDTRPPRVDEEDGVPGRQETHRRGRLGMRERRAREVEELAARLVAEAAQRQPLERRCDVARLHASPAGDVAARRRPEPAEVPADEMVERRRPRSTSSGPTQRSAVWKRCARRFSHVPEGERGRARATGPTIPQLRPTTSTSSSCRRGPSAISARSSSARRSRSRSCGRGFCTRSHQSRCGARIATANGQ